jgi:hypothetical protein
VVGIEHIGYRAVAAESLERQRRDKLRCMLRHNNVNVRTRLFEQADKLARLISRNAARNAYGNCLA